MLTLFQEFGGEVDQIKLESSDLCAVKLDPDLGVEYETVEDVSLEDAANVYFRQAVRILSKFLYKARNWPIDRTTID